jgi:hypothetical protein
MALSHVVRHRAEDESPVHITQELAKHVLQAPHLPNVAEQAENLVLWLGRHLPGPGERVVLKPWHHGAILGSATDAAFDLVVDHLTRKGTLQTEMGGTTLSFEGWQWFEELRRGRSTSRKAFMAMKYGDALLNRVFTTCFKPAVAMTGFELMKLDERPVAGLIDNRLRTEILTSRFLIADLTHGNQGAYWEAGFAEGLRKRVFYTCEESAFKAGTHFDTNHMHTVVWTEANLAKAAEDLKATIRATLPEEARMRDDQS